MTLLQKLKEKLGLAEAEEAAGTEAEVTIEREAGEAGEAEEVSEPIAEPTDASASTESLVGEEEAAEETAEAAEVAEAAGPGEEAEEVPGEASASVDTIKGIGPAYAERLSNMGIETVADLAAADPAEVGEQASVGENRAATWIDRASEE
ncbi:MAG: helix-hairpin-helix domain-containing protein [Halopenitus sp.]